MPEKLAFYSQTYDRLPEMEMRAVAGNAQFKVDDTEEGRRITYRWPDLTITINEMPLKQIPSHLDGFCGFVRHLYTGQPDARGDQVLDRIRYTRLIAGIVIDPKRDESGRAENVLAHMANGLDAMLFFGGGLYDQTGRLILASDGTFESTADVLGPVATMAKRVQVDQPERKSHTPTAAQDARYRRTLAQLELRRVPTFGGTLFIDDDATATVRDAATVAQRALVLFAVTCLADGGDRETSLKLLDAGHLWPYVTPEELRFLKAEDTDHELARKLLWRLEAAWVLVWALGELDLPWPGGCCDTARLTRTLTAYHGDQFVKNATLRPKAEILDALQWTMLLHWTVRDAFLHDRQIPVDLDWSSGSEMVSAQNSPATGVVAERHHALNWLTGFGDRWDDVETPT